MLESIKHTLSGFNISLIFLIKTVNISTGELKLFLQ